MDGEYVLERSLDVQPCLVTLNRNDLTGATHDLLDPRAQVVAPSSLHGISGYNQEGAATADLMEMPPQLIAYELEVIVRCLPVIRQLARKDKM